MSFIALIFKKCIPNDTEKHEQTNIKVPNVLCVWLSHTSIKQMLKKYDDFSVSKDFGKGFRPFMRSF